MRSIFRKVHARGASFASNTSGNVAIITALSAFPMIFGVTAVASYSNVLMMRQSVQVAADAAALAATTAYANGQVTTPQDAQSIAMQYFQANAPAQLGSSPQPTVTVTPPQSQGAGTVTTTVSYTGSVPNLMSSLLGSQTGFSVSSTVSQAVTASYTGGLNGAVDMYGDPHVLQVIDSNGTVVPYLNPSRFQVKSCVQATKKHTKKWINIFSAPHIQINGSCVAKNLYDKWGWVTRNISTITNVNVVVDGHNLALVPDLISYTNTFSLTMDGVAVIPDQGNLVPTEQGVDIEYVDNGTLTQNVNAYRNVPNFNTYYDSAACQTTNGSDDTCLSTTASGTGNDMFLQIKISGFTITINEVWGGKPYNQAAFEIYISANNALDCVTPGGILGQEFGVRMSTYDSKIIAGTLDSNSGDFRVHNPFQTFSQYDDVCLPNVAETAFPVITQ